MAGKKQKTESKHRSKPFPIVAIGASAGGLEAITELLQNLPIDTGMAYVYIQHMDPTHQSMLASILTRTTKMKVQEASEILAIEPNQVYVIPPDKDLIMVDGKVAPNPRKANNGIHMPIDEFFLSLAEHQSEGAIGIVLSGNANDGTLGLKAIKNSGGFTFAQDESAKFQSMPKSAIAERVVDMVLSPKDMARELENISKKTDILKELSEPIHEDDISNSDQDLTNIILLIKKTVGVDFTHYKRNTIKRRIIRRMLLHKLETLHEYFGYLKDNSGEIHVLYQDILINVTHFFRDPETFEYLKKTLFPRILKNKKTGEVLRMWVPACSTGEEAYSIAILIAEIMGDKASSANVQIFATDLSESAIAKARLGLYSRNDLAEVAPRRLQRFFTKVDGSYRISKFIRDLCVFAPHNVFKDPPFSRIDFISCRNLMIYLDTVLQKKIVTTFHYSLNPGGYLMVGKSETIGVAANLFLQAEKKYKIYARKQNMPRGNLEIATRLPELHKTGVSAKGAQMQVSNAQDLDDMLNWILLSKYTPPCVIVNQELDILMFRGSTGLFLEPLPGKASLNLLRMARPGLSFELRNAIHKASKSDVTIKKSGLEVKINKTIHHVAIEVTRLHAQEGEEILFLVTFQELESLPAPEHKGSSKDKKVKQLQEELNSLREDMRSIVEEQEASNEELQSANEEIVSSNEELQSINEELETSKEEVESTNEELMTINTELQVRNEQLAEAYEYAEAVFGTIREAVVVLDQEFRLRKANRAFYKIFQLDEDETEGMLIYDLSNRSWNIPKLKELLADIIPSNGLFHNMEIRHEFPGIGEKILLVNARKIIQKIHQRELILLAIEDRSDNAE